MKECGRCGGVADNVERSVDVGKSVDVVERSEDVGRSVDNVERSVGDGGIWHVVLLGGTAAPTEAWVEAGVTGGHMLQ
jgi:hypothetical protein